MGGEQDCEAASPVDSPPTHLRPPCTQPHSLVDADKSGVEFDAESCSWSLSRHAKPKLEL